jgi:hypothetical protein
MKRILVLMTVVALMMAMMAMAVAPAFAAWNPATGCRTGDDRLNYLFAQDPSAAYLADGKWNNDFHSCQHQRHNGVYVYYDNRNVE